jgi:hypothetical protein
MNACNLTPSPEWARLPTRGPDPLFGLSRAFYYQLITAGQIKTACIRRPGASTGVRLVHVPSVRAYIEKHIEVHASSREG